MSESEAMVYAVGAAHQRGTAVCGQPPGQWWRGSPRRQLTRLGVALLLAFCLAGSARAADDEVVGTLGAVGSDTLAGLMLDRKSTRLNSSHVRISYAVFCLKK